jgi:GDP-4-dehydro-6-deoxy-D-mannose reductase
LTHGAQTVLLLGGTGFAGTHLAHILEQDRSVFACGREVDVRSREALRAMVAHTRPDQVVNLASVTTVRESFADPSTTYMVGLHGMLNLLTVLKESGFSGRVLHISSSEVYGHPSPEDLPITETSPLRPMSPYAVAKLATEFLCYQCWRTDSIEIVTARPFTHIGPGQSARFAVSAFARQIAEIMLGRREPVMHVGDLTTTRDFTDVRDIARAYRLLLDAGEPGDVYNVCAGTEVSLQGLLDTLLANAGLAIRVETNAAMLRETEQRRLRGSYDTLARATGWRPEIALEQTLTDTLDFWLRRLK